MNCGSFVPILSSVDEDSAFNSFHFTPKNGNSIIIGGNVKTIPGGVAVISGGVVTELDDCIIEGTANQQAAANTNYYVYAFMDGSTMRLNLSSSAHKEDTTYGNEVHVSDAGQSIVGMIRTNANGR